MDSTKQQYLESIRSNTAYPTYRIVITFMSVLGYISAAAAVIAPNWLARSGDEGTQLAAGVVGLVAGLFLLVTTKFFSEVAVILADISDSTVEVNARTTSQDASHREVGGIVIEE